MLSGIYQGWKDPVARQDGALDIASQFQLAPSGGFAPNRRGVYSLAGAGAMPGPPPKPEAIARREHRPTFGPGQVSAESRERIGFAVIILRLASGLQRWGPGGRIQLLRLRFSGELFFDSAQ